MTRRVAAWVRTRLPAGVTRRELALVGAAMALALAIVAVYVVAHRHAILSGDEVEYDVEGAFFTMGKWWWGSAPYGIAHASAWKAPVYPAWVGLWYTILGHSPARVEMVQAFLAPITVGLTWLLARRFFDARVAVGAAFVTAGLPLLWEYYGLLYPECLAVPLTLLALLLSLGREPTPRRAAAVGLVVGIGVLTRPSTFFVLAGVAVAWWLAAGARRGLAQTAIAVGVAVLVVLPWTIRNYDVTNGFVPISVQDGALAGTFNPDSANDPVYPYAWRPNAPAIAELFDPRHPLGDAELRSQLIDRGLNYIGDHPESVPAAFFWNGLSRLWDVRRPSRALNEVAFEGRSRAVTKVGLAMYYVLLPLALAGLWLIRRRPELLWPILALALAASVVFTVDSGTRYRAPLEPFIAMLGCLAAVTLLDRVRARSAQRS